jgi:hypothetical protein
MCRLAAPIVARRGLVSPGIGHCWLPVWLRVVSPASLMFERSNAASNPRQACGAHVLLRIYAKCVVGQDELAKRRTSEALRQDRYPSPPAGPGTLQQAVVSGRYRDGQQLGCPNLLGNRLTIGPQACEAIEPG